RARMLGRMMGDPRGQQLTTQLTDRLFRSRDDARTLDEAAHLLRRLGVPRYMRFHEQLALRGVRSLAPLRPPGLAGAVRAKVRSQARAVLLDADKLGEHLQARHEQSVRVNVNKLGEALLGEREAEQRVQAYVELAARGDIDALSVKVSSIGSQLNLLAFEATVETLRQRLARIYTATLTGDTLVMLDMEAYAHVELTLAVLERTLADGVLDKVRAGVVLQAYLPDGAALLERVQRLNDERVARGGMPLRIRIVKGANLAHERVESARAGLSLPMFGSKLETDANYKLLLERALTGTLRLGVASHNLFDLAYALLLSAEREHELELELLEGMADPVQRTLTELGVTVLVYAPVCRDDDFNSGIAYLVRRLDENTAHENFLRSSFDMRVDSPAFERERERFLASVARVDQLDLTARRAHDEGYDRALRAERKFDFLGAPDTDFTHAENRRWIQRALDALADEEPPLVCSRIGGELVGGRVIDGVDPSRPGAVPYRVALAADVTRAIELAHADPEGHGQRSLEERANLLVRCAAALRDARAQLIACLVQDGGKRVVEADAEVSEAIDFAEYYRASFADLMHHENVEATARGVVLVTPPWNFPLAIPAGGVLAALMAGSRVLFKPALETPRVGALLASVLWSAGVPKSALQLLICEDEVASTLVRDPRVTDVILTGATSTARLFQKLRPGLRLLAETGGKNAYIVTAMSDRELAIRDAVHSAFGHAGQKCSATSLLILVREVYDDPAFRATLKDAVESLHVGPAWDARSFVTPLIREPGPELQRGLTTLEAGESWLVEPRHDENLWSPGVKLGVTAGSFTHRTELFGPVLGVMRADSLAHAVELANATGYGLTAGLASLDEREQAYFIEHLRAGNLYVNRTTTGAIVRRQPFGGVGKSGFGPGAKAGGPNYVAQLCQLHERSSIPYNADRTFPPRLESRVRMLEPALAPRARWLLRARVQSYLQARTHFAGEHDPERLLGQHNRFRYRPVERCVLRVEADAEPGDLAASCLAAELAGARLDVSVDPAFSLQLDASALGHPVHVEPVEALVERGEGITRVRILGTRPQALDRLNEAHGSHLADEPVLALGRFELLHYVSEQSVSIEYHRYGNIPD
ncbi:MAG TPA: bifunctional proline dehydrogenase/L-glutamate gamma-semialdehyde dehydrogenase, partial [Polyangiales bacterium]|nr:bifunctional proline dehydrogenase/L-glutamate gamma-semialdehyde dehydrogenase [Polyangiales bacterium]